MQFTCLDAVYNVTLTLNVYRSTNPSGVIGGSGNLVTAKTCDSITGPCQILIPCTEGRWMAGYPIAGTTDGTYEVYFDDGEIFSYSAGDCTL